MVSGGKADGPVTQTSPFHTVVMEEPPMSLSRRNSQTSGLRIGTAPRQKWRLLLVSSRARHVNPIAQSLNPGVLLVTFKYETSTLDDILCKSK